MISDTDTTFTVADASKLSTGLIQIEDEVLFVRSIDRASNTVILEPWGRGLAGSTATSHGIDARIINAPAAPRARVRDMILQVLHEIFPMVYAVDTAIISTNAAQVNYGLPNDVYSVLAVEYNPPGPTQSWHPLRRWRQNRTPTGVELEIISPTTPGNNRVRVHYIKNAPNSLDMSDDLEAMGYPPSIRELVTLGVAVRLAAFAESVRVQVTGPESAARAEVVPAGSASGLSRYLYQFFRQRLDDEARNTQQRYPIVTHFTR